ncbi:MAG: hypothetical protein QME14_00735 [Methanobacteriaceae archaeon]|nr:hypothetical protein [Methanobacteriaceae archaeon]
MGIFDSKEKSEEELISEFQSEGFKCETIVGSVGRSGGDKAMATLMFGLAGFAATYGKKRSKSNWLSLHERKGPQIHSRRR